MWFKKSGTARRWMRIGGSVRKYSWTNETHKLTTPQPTWSDGTMLNLKETIQEGKICHALNIDTIKEDGRSAYHDPEYAPSEHRRYH